MPPSKPPHLCLYAAWTHTLSLSLEQREKLTQHGTIAFNVTHNWRNSLERLIKFDEAVADGACMCVLHVNAIRMRNRHEDSFAHTPKGLKPVSFATRIRLPDTTNKGTRIDLYVTLYICRISCFTDFQSNAIEIPLIYLRHRIYTARNSMYNF